MLKELGRYFELPLTDCLIKQIVFDGLIRLVFKDDSEQHIYLDLHGEFLIEESGHNRSFSPRQKEALLLFYDWFQQDVSIEEAKADKQGSLFITLDNRRRLIVEDGQYENWHFTIINHKQPYNNLFVHGGVGSTYW
ncbi:MAG: hypothetical protein EOO55_03250 [Hymenobacter sp.]|nr:MAG: hypothetical protein EOO55_03250 [Hymenobacter sp.]